ncbi:ribonuclease H-like domain-containing protein [Tanacetum coccineum]
MSFDDLYNNFKIVEQEVKGTTNSSSSSISQNMAFMSSLSSTNEVNTAYGVSSDNSQVSPASTQVSIVSTLVSTANISDATVYAFLSNQPNGSQLIHEDLEQIHEDDLEEMDLKWQLALLSMRTKRFFQKTGRKITINRSDTARYDKSKVECFNYHKIGYFARECRGPRNYGNRNRNQDNSRRTINVEETSSKAMVAIDGAGFDWSYMTDNEVPTNIDLMAFSDSEPEFEGYGPKTSKSVSEDTSNEVRESPDAPLVEELVSDDKLDKKIIFPTVAKIEFVRPKQQEKLVKYAKMYRSQGPRGNQRNWNNQKSQQLGSDFVMYNKACFVCGSFDHVQDNYNYHQRERMASGNNYTKIQVSDGLDFKKFDGGYVTFEGGAKGGKITGKGTLETGKLDFEDVYFVKELQFNLFSVSQMCDKKNSVLFTDTGYFIMSPDYKLGDESQVLLKVPRKNNMYSVDMKNIVPKESLTCLVEKATLDESMLWYRKLASKDETSGILKSFITQIKNLVDKKVKIIRCDNGTKFKNRVMSEFCEKKGIKKEFSIARTPQKNGVTERRNRILIEVARTMLADSKLPTTFWAEVVNTVCYGQNRVLVVNPHNKTPYELFRGRTPVWYIVYHNTGSILGFG